MSSFASFLGRARDRANGRIRFRPAFGAMAAAALLVMLWLRGEILDLITLAVLAPFEMLWHLLRLVIWR